MAPGASTHRELQDQSIKARKHELFVGDEYNDAGPRKTFREYLRETPAAPLSKNVKMILWGSAAPVAFLFVAALLSSKGSDAKPPEYSILPVNQKPAPYLAKTDVAPAVVSEPPRAEPTVKNEEKPKAEKLPEAAPKTKKKQGKNKKNQPKAEAPKTDESAKKDIAKADESAKKDDKTKMPAQAKATNSETKEPGTAKAPEPEKPKKESLFKKPKRPVYTYPKKDPVGEKKAEPEKPSPSP